jgi:methionine-rich copper-binding protein CopC
MSRSTIPPTPRPARWTRRARVGALAALLWAAGLAGAPAEAHAVLVRSSPSHRAVLGQGPDQVQLWFNERLEAAYSTVSVWNEAGAQIDGRDVLVGPDDPKRLSVSLPAHGPGIYTVKYRVLSVDGHVVDSVFTFTVRRP